MLGVMKYILLLVVESQMSSRTVWKLGIYLKIPQLLYDETPLEFHPISLLLFIQQ